MWHLICKNRIRILTEDEDIELVAYTIEELIEKVMSNEIQDVKTMAAILAYYYKYCNK